MVKIPGAPSVGFTKHFISCVMAVSLILSGNSGMILICTVSQYLASASCVSRTLASQVEYALHLVKENPHNWYRMDEEIIALQKLSMIRLVSQR